VNVEQFDFHFYVNGKEIKAHADKFMMAKYPQVRVWFRVKNEEKVFTFYLLPKELFWFQLLVNDEQLAYSAATFLAKKYNVTITKRAGLVGF